MKGKKLKICSTPRLKSEHGCPSLISILLYLLLIHHTWLATKYRRPPPTDQTSNLTCGAPIWHVLCAWAPLVDISTWSTRCFSPPCPSWMWYVGLVWLKASSHGCDEVVGLIENLIWVSCCDVTLIWNIPNDELIFCFFELFFLTCFWFYFISNLYIYVWFFSLFYFYLANCFAIFI
jgi:hypothetical protein